MTTTVRFLEIVLTTAKNRHTYRLGDGVNLVLGPVGAGKTSLLELTRYAIGGRGVLSQAAVEAVQRVTVTAKLGESTYLLSRRVGATTVDAYSADGTQLETLTTQQSSRFRSASAFLLEATGLPAVRLAKSRRRPTAQTEPLSFFDVFSYCYLPQSEIDRSVVRHLDPMRDRKRRATFEFLFGLSDVETADAERRVGELNDRLQEAKRRETTVRAFLEQAGDASEPTLLAEYDRLVHDAEAARRDLTALRLEMRAVTASQDERRRRLGELAAQAQASHGGVERIKAQLVAHAQLLAQLELELQQVGRRRSAEAALTGIDFITCPRCRQGLAALRRDAGQCRLCGQPEQVSRAEQALAPSDEQSGQLSLGDEWGPSDERARIRALMDEVRVLADADQQSLDDALGERRALEASVHEMELDLDRRTQSYVSPRFEAIAELSARVASAESRQDSLQRALAYWATHRELVTETSTITRELQEAVALLAESRAALESRKSRVVDLSDIFAEIVRDIRPPWSQTARIDLNTYLPIINGASFDQLSGGEKTIINVAYQLALLTYALSMKATLLPSLLILDTPRKNLGAGVDQQLADRIYRRVGVLADAYGKSFQMIIADNDPPGVPTPTSSVITLNYQRPLIPDLDHPGPEVESVSDRMEREGD